ncbi:MAG: SpoIIE family protein phosphatase [Anaerolineae bacterium]|jgi:serine phosphatase RsbU (regulator of sigma subunit)/anti-sigma regulatory factor (Ser/Thr protein kinase)
MRAGGSWRQLRATLVTWSFVPAVLILVAAGVATLVAYEQVVQDEIVGRERERVNLSANRLKEELSKFSDVLQSLARTEAIYQDRPSAQRAALRDARRRLSVLEGGVLLLDNFGRVQGTQPDRPEVFGQDWSARPYFRRLLTGERVVFSDVLPDGPGGSPVVVVSVPITSAEGEFLGALVGMFRLGQPTVSALYASLVRLRMGDRAYLVDGNGQVIYHSEPEHIGEYRAGDPAVGRVLNGQVAAYRTADDEGTVLVVGVAPVPGTSWGLVAETEWAALTSPSRRYGRFLLVLLALGIALPAAWFGLLARERRGEAVERAHIEHQLQVARLIQQTLLPRQSPELPGWRMYSHYQPAQAVGGDFYDFLHLEDGRLGLVVGDVTDKGMPAALLMATTRSLLRTVAEQVHSPGEVLRRVNELLAREIPPKMFVTCLYAVLDPATGRLRYANAGHNLPYRSHPGNGGVAELRARGMPLGLMPDMEYEEKETTIAPGECLVFYSDGLVEAHNPRREMFGGRRLQGLLDDCAGECPTLIQHLLAEMAAFTGRGWEQEDDVTLVTLQRTGSQEAGPPEGWRSLARLSLPSEPGNERQAMQAVAEAVEEHEVALPPARVERLKTAVAEAAMNAIEHGNHYQPDLEVGIHVLASDEALAVRISDHGDGRPIPPAPRPDLEAKIAGRQSPRGWGLFLIENMVDQVRVMQVDDRNVFELVLLFKDADVEARPLLAPVPVATEGGGKNHDRPST